MSKSYYDQPDELEDDDLLRLVPARFKHVVMDEPDERTLTNLYKEGWY